MQKKEYILTICIPTYNRADLLTECVDSIVTQIDETLLPFVGIHIFDNASDDGTKEYCEKLIVRYPYIKYTRNDENLGPDKNFYKILQFDTESQFKHLLSDDDKYAPQSLKELVEYLSSNKVLHFVYLNYAHFKTSKSNKLYGILCPSLKTISYITKYEFIDIVKNEYSFLSGMVFNSEIVDLKGIEKFIGTYWFQSYALFNSTVNSENKVAFYGPVTIYNRLDDFAVSYNPLKVFGPNYFELAQFAYDKCGYDKKQMLKMVAIRWKKTLYYAKLNKLDKSEYKEILEICKREKYLKFVSFYAKIPHWLCVLYHKLKYAFKG